jgi:hypothetical protein
MDNRDQLRSKNGQSGTQKIISPPQQFSFWQETKCSSKKSTNPIDFKVRRPANKIRHIAASFASSSHLIHHENKHELQ